MSRTTNGWVATGDKNATANDRFETYDDGSGQQQLIDLFKIASQVDSINPDYFIALHSNATGGGDGKKVNYLLYMYRGETGNDYAKGSIDRAQVAFPFVYDNPLTVWTVKETDRYVAGDLTWMGGTPPGKSRVSGRHGSRPCGVLALARNCAGKCGLPQWPPHTASAHRYCRLPVSRRCGSPLDGQGRKRHRPWRTGFGRCRQQVL